MDLLPLINQALDEVGIDPNDDPQFVGMVRAAAPYVTKLATEIQDQLAPNMPRNGPSPIAINAEIIEPPQPDPLAHDRAAGIPVFDGHWPY